MCSVSFFNQPHCIPFTLPGMRKTSFQHLSIRLLCFFILFGSDDALHLFSSCKADFDSICFYHNNRSFPISHPFTTRTAREVMPAYGCLVKTKIAELTIVSTIPVTRW